MAKNLKLNIKNAQLAEALKIGQIKKAPTKKKKSEKVEEVHAENQPLSVEATSSSIQPQQELIEKSSPPSPSSSSIEPSSFAKEGEKAEPVKKEEQEDQLNSEKQSLPPRRETTPPSQGNESNSQRSEPYSPSPRHEGGHPSQQREGGSSYPPRREGGYSPQQREGGSSYPPRRDGGGYPPRREGGYSPQQREGGSSYPPRRDGGGYPPRREGGYPPQQREGGSSYPPRRDGGGYPPRREGGYSPQQREGGSSYPPRRDGGGYPPRREGGYPPQQREGGSSYPPRRDGGGYPPRREGGYPPQQREGGSSYPPRRDGGGYPPRREGGYSPQQREGGSSYPPRRDGGGYPPRREGGGYPPRSGPGGGMGPNAPRPFTSSPDTARNEKGGRVVNREEPRKKIVTKETKEVKPLRKNDSRGFDARDRLGLRDNVEEQGWRKKRNPHKMRSLQQEEIIRPKSLTIRLPISIKDLAAEMKLKASQLISKMFMKGVVLTLNDYLDDETAIQLLGNDFDCEISIDTREEERLRVTDKTIKKEIQDANEGEIVYRPPVVTFMGHVDHGKTSLIDAIRKSNIASGEAGAITQHIGAFKCHTDSGDITVLDTPGHEAFSAMRARGAIVTDIVVLVVAGDEGIRPQTIEAIEQAQTATVPIVVAINKCDKPAFNAENVYRQLAEQNLLPEAWGGQTITVNCSAMTGVGIKELLEMLALQAEVLELKANPHFRARGTVIESEMHKGMGAVATLLVQNGTLRKGDAVVFAQNYARVKTMQDEFGKNLDFAGPSTPIKITGLSGLPEAGSEFIVVKNEKEAIEIADKRREGKRHAQQLLTKRSGMESLLAEKSIEVKKKYLNLILRADVQGSVEALKTSLLKIVSQKVELNILSAAVGEISESDVQLASASKAIIVGFHTEIESHAENLIKQLKVTIKMHDIIYHAVDDIREMMKNLLDKIAQESDTGAAEVKTTFKSSQIGVIAGCMVTDGVIKRNQHIRQVRDHAVIWKGPIASLKRVKEDVKEVSKGYECGILLQNNSDVRIGDLLQAFEITYLEQEL